MRRLGFALILAVFCATDLAFAQAKGMVGAAGQLTSTAGAKGAAVNREVSDQLFGKAMTYEKQAWSKFPPDVGLLTKSFALARDAAAAESQSKELARAGLHGAASGAESGDIHKLGLELVGKDKMTEWATQSSEASKDASARLAKYEKYGIRLDRDTMSLKTPAGDIDLRKEAFAEGGQISKIASYFGYNPADVKKALTESQAERDAIVKSAASEVESRLAEKEAALKARAETGAEPGALGSEDPNSREIAGLSAETGEENAGDAAKALLAAAASADPEAVPLADTELEAVKLRQEAVNENLNAVRRQMGLNEVTPAEAIGKPDQDIFKMVHQRYLAVEETGAFLN